MGGRRKRTLNAFRRLCVPKPSFASNSMVLIPPALDDRHPVGFRRAGDTVPVESFENAGIFRVVGCLVKCPSQPRCP